MPKLDRLSALMSRFELRVTPSAPDNANLWVLGKSPLSPELLLFGDALSNPVTNILIAARVDWGGVDNPMIAALPGTVRILLPENPQMHALATLLLSEQQQARCGAASVLNRLGEVLVVQLMRSQIEAGNLETGLLKGLADPRLSRAIVAIHDQPATAWRVDSLAAEAGLSVSRFAELFKQAIGVTPLAYLRRWRLTLARQDIARGDRVQSVAAKYCYGSTEALSRAVLQTYGQTPTQIRKSARA